MASRSDGVKILRDGKLFSKAVPNVCPQCGKGTSYVNYNDKRINYPFHDVKIHEDIYICENDACECKFSVETERRVEKHKAEGFLGVIFAILSIVLMLAAAVFLILFIMAAIEGTTESLPWRASSYFFWFLGLVASGLIFGLGCDWDSL